MPLYSINQFAFTPASSNATTDENATGKGAKMSMMSMASSHHNVYSDLEQSSSDEETPSTEKTDSFFGKSQSFSKNDNKSDHLNRYGIGAALLMKMGYEQGKGLGSKGDGIVNPIETKLRPQGLGVGGIKEKMDDDMEVDSSDNEQFQKPKPRINLFKVIEDIEQLQLEVPRKYKLLSDNYKSKKHVGDDIDSKVEEEFQKLTKIRDEIAELNKKESFLNYNTEVIEKALEVNHKEIKTSQELICILDDINIEFSETKDEEERIICISSALKKLASDIYLSNTKIRSLFVSVAAMVVPELFAKYFKECSSMDHIFSSTLSEWSLLYREIEVTSHSSIGYWDSLMLQNISGQIKDMINIEHTEMFHTNLLNILSFWVDAPIIINGDLVISRQLTKDVIDPFMRDLIEKWQVGFIETSPHYFLIDYISVLRIEDYEITKLWIQKITDTYMDYVKIDGINSFWQKYLEASDGMEHYEEYIHIELARLNSIWIPIFDQFLGSEIKDKVIGAFLDSVCYFMSREKWYGSSSDIKRLNLVLAIFYDLKDFTLINEKQKFDLLQFKLFNPWCLTLNECLQSNSGIGLKVATWYQKWYDYFRKMSYKYDLNPSIIAMIDWYLNTSLSLISSKANGIYVATPRLPSIKGDNVPSNQELCKFLQKSSQSLDDSHREVNTKGIPSYQLITSFKDIVSMYCTDHDILFSSMKNKFHDQLGLPLYKLDKSGKILYCYIQDDVIWVSSKIHGEQDSDYMPISLDSLSSMI